MSRLRRLWFATLALAVCGCQPDGVPDPATLRLDDGRALTDVVTANGFHVVFVARPADCFACITQLSLWRAWSQEQSGERFSLVLAGSPTAAESNGLRLLRLAPAGSMAHDQSSRLTDLPAEFLFEDGVLIDYEVAQAGALSWRRLERVGAR